MEEARADRRLVDERRVGARASAIVPTTGSSSYSTVDRRDGGLGGGLVDRGDRRDRLADVAHAVDRDDRPVLDRVARVGVDVQEVGAGQHRDDAGHRLGGRVSMATIRACGSGLRRTLPWSIPGHADVADVDRPRPELLGGVDARHRAADLGPAAAGVAGRSRRAHARPPRARDESSTASRIAT